MRIPARLIAGMTFLLLSIPSLAAAGEHEYRERAREAAYRAGFDNGYRTGLHHGEYDFRAHLGYGYRGRDHFRDDHYFGFRYGRDREFRKGFQDGYRRGYREGYERFAYPPRARRYYYER